MNEMSNQEMEIMGYEPVYDYTQYSHDKHVNVIPEKDFKKLIQDTFETISDVMRSTYGPYGSTIVISDQNETTTTKDGFNVFEAMGFSHHYKRMVYLAIKKICERVNRNVGDGTTSCILLADKMFRKISDIIKTPDDKRTCLLILNDIEADLLNPSYINEDTASGRIGKLSRSSMKNLISLAGNYDNDLTNILMDAFHPEYDDNDYVTSIRNVVADVEVDYSADANATYSFDYLPGDYRIRVNMDDEFGLALTNTITPAKIAIYDHAYNHTDWDNFLKNYDTESESLSIIISRSFTKGFMDNDYVRYMHKCAIEKKPVMIYLCEIKGDHIQNEIKDLSALLGTEANTLESIKAIDHETLPVANVQIYKGNCMCFHLDDKTPPEKYIKKIEREMNKDLSNSYIKRREYLDRIKALSLKSKDTLITVKGSSSLEVKMITDKIDDCTSICQSALVNGIVPNMLKYVYDRISEASIRFEKATIEDNIYKSICASIKGLFNDIWISKYGADANNDDTLNDVLAEFYSGGFNVSYDIIQNRYKKPEELPTSVQYDLEVVIAAISIVKYLLTSRALIFDAGLLRMTGDQGHYEKSL